MLYKCNILSEQIRKMAVRSRNSTSPRCTKGRIAHNLKNHFKEAKIVQPDGIEGDKFQRSCSVAQKSV